VRLKILFKCQGIAVFIVVDKIKIGPQQLFSIIFSSFSTAWVDLDFRKKSLLTRVVLFNIPEKVFIHTQSIGISSDPE
jgi:hypothetical protein